MGLMPPHWKGWFSYKFRRAGVRWEVAICIRTGWAVWIHGPLNDLVIFRHSLLSHLDENERTEADDIYAGKPAKTLTPKLNLQTDEDAEYRQYVRNRHETVNKRFKDWKCLKVQFRHGLRHHSAMFRAVVIITQLQIESGEALFQVHYDMENFSLPFLL